MHRDQINSSFNIKKPQVAATKTINLFNLTEKLNKL